MDWYFVAIIVGIVFLALLAVGMPIAFALGVVGIAGSFLMVSKNATLGMLASVPYSTLAEFLLLAIPLFIFMSEMLIRSKASSMLYDTCAKWFSSFPGSLAVSTVGASAIFAAVCGSSVATCATIGPAAIPEMKRRGYEAELITGSVGAGGALGMLIPPSIPAILYGMLTEVSIGALFIAMLIPGIVLALLHTGVIVTRVKLKPSIAPRPSSVSWSVRLRSVTAALPFFVVIILVLGSIYLGVTTVTEAAAIGAVASIIVAAIFKRLSLETLISSAKAAALATSYLLIIFLGATFFSFFVTQVNIPQQLTSLVASFQISPWGILILIQVLYLILGCFLDVGSMILVTIPTVFPLIKALGFDPVWFGVLLIINCEAAAITPPVGLNLYVIQGIAPDIPLARIIRGIWPFVLADIACIAIVAVFPSLALWLPSLMR